MLYSDCLIVDNILISDRNYLMTLKCEDMAKLTRSGQFFLLTSPSPETILKRPISIFDVDHEKGELQFYYKVFGKGTHYISQLKKGEKISIMGPLGRGFNTNLENKKILLIGAGVGIAPFQYLQKELSKNNSVYLGLGCQSKNDLKITELILSENITFCTDDGSQGLKMNVVQLAKQMLEEHKNDPFTHIYCCAPNIVLKKIGLLALENNLECQLSLESHMACGVKACAGCSCKTNSGMKKICADGPIFNAKDLILEEL